MKQSKTNQLDKTGDLQEQASYKQYGVRSRYIPCSNQEQHTNHRCCCSTPYLLLSCILELCLESKFLKKLTQGTMIRVQIGVVDEQRRNSREKIREKVVKIGFLLLCYSSPFIRIRYQREWNSPEPLLCHLSLDIFLYSSFALFFNNKLNNYPLLPLLIGSNKY